MQDSYRPLKLLLLLRLSTPSLALTTLRHLVKPLWLRIISSPENTLSQSIVVLIEDLWIRVLLRDAL